MGGSGGAGFFRTRADPDRAKSAIRDAERRTQDQAYESRVQQSLNELLVQYNERDTETIGTYLGTIKEVLQEDIEGTIDLRFGGSIEKYTYVDGLSDVDCLVLLKDPELESMSPREVLAYFRDKLEEELHGVERVTAGELAVTLTYSDGTEIQLLPAIRKGSGFVISTSRGDQWSHIIRPERFAARLTELNQVLGGKVVPTIKLAKAVIVDLPERHQLTGYHIESLAIEAFKHYEGPKTTKNMLEHFFDKAKDLVKQHIKDKTGQSVNVDEYLGHENSSLRVAISSELDRIARRMKNANGAHLVSEWLRAIGE